MVDANVEAISTEVEGGVGEDESHAISGRTLSEIACILRANSQFGEGHAAIQYADVDLWFGIRPTVGEGHAVIHYADVDNTDAALNGQKLEGPLRRYLRCEVC